MHATWAERKAGSHDDVLRGALCHIQLCAMLLHTIEDVCQVSILHGNSSVGRLVGRQAGTCIVDEKFVTCVMNTLQVLSDTTGGCGMASHWSHVDLYGERVLDAFHRSGCSCCVRACEVVRTRVQGGMSAVGYRGFLRTCACYTLGTDPWQVSNRVIWTVRSDRAHL